MKFYINLYKCKENITNCQIFRVVLSHIIPQFIYSTSYLFSPSLCSLHSLRVRVTNCISSWESQEEAGISKYK